MNPSEMLEQLRVDHERLRAMMALVRVAADRVAWGERSRALHGALLQLAEALHAQNVREEQLARELELASDVNRFVDMLMDEHVAEHRHIYEALLVATVTTDTRAAGAMASALCERLGEHMKHEEDALLVDAILRDRERARGSTA